MDQVEGNQAYVGITDYAQQELGDVVYVELPDAGGAVRYMEPFGVVESVKAVSDLFSPVTGAVKQVNEELFNRPELVNSDPYGQGWMLLVQIGDPTQLETLMTAEQYQAYLRQARRDDALHPQYRCRSSGHAGSNRAPTVEDLFSGIPEGLRFAGPLNIPKALAEQDVLRHMRTLAGHNANVENYAAFLGAGAYHHFIPSIVPVLTSRGEFMTAYTPYQPEMAQGTLQAMYEYQTLICQLTDMEVANASLYDASTGVAEAVLMARRVTQRDECAALRSCAP